LADVSKRALDALVRVTIRIFVDMLADSGNNRAVQQTDEFERVET